MHDASSADAVALYRKRASRMMRAFRQERVLGLAKSLKGRFLENGGVRCVESRRVVGMVVAKQVP